MKLHLSPARLHQIMYTMVYPAVLGSFLYTFWDKTAKGRFEWSDPLPWLIGLLFIALLTLDYVYSLAAAIVARYSLVKFVLDLLIVVLLYLTLQALFKEKVEVVDKVLPWVWLFLIKLLAVAWELADRSQQVAGASGTRAEKARAVPLVNIETDTLLLILAVLFGALAIVSPAWLQVVYYAAWMLLDGLLYIANTSDA